nr:glycosyltransferase family 39 protein [Allomuricauda sp.]
MEFLKRYDCIFIFLFSAIICTSFIGSYPIYILDEARNSEAAREMLVSKNFIVPTFNGMLRTDKPPLHYFFMTLGYRIFGVNAFGARFLSGIFGALTVLVTYWNVKKYKSQELGFITVLILWSALFFVQEFHLAVPDPYLIFFIAFSLFSFFNFYSSKKWPWLVYCYLAIGFGFLTKGPVAMVLPGLAILAFLLFKRSFNMKTIVGLKPILGLLIVLVVAGPWYYWVHLETDGAWTRGFFLDHNISRFGSEKEGHGGLFLITPLYVILGLLPFSVFIIQAFVQGWWVRKSDEFVLFSFLVSSVTILFFSISSTKLPNYPMPCYPFVAILIAFYLERILNANISRRSLLWSILFLLVVSLALSVGGYIALGLEKQFIDVQWVSLWLAIAPISCLVTYYLYRKNLLKKAFFTLAGGWILMGLLLFGIIYPKLTAKSPVSLAEQFISKDSHVVAFKRFDSAFPINFQRTFEVAESIEALDLIFQERPETIIITNTRSKEDLELLSKYQLILEQKALFENHTTRMYKK